MDTKYIREQITTELREEVVVSLWNEYCLDDGDISAYFENFDDYGISNIYGVDNLYDIVKNFILSAKDNDIDLNDEYLRLDNYGYPRSYSVNEAIKLVDIDALTNWVAKQNDEWRVTFNRVNKCNLKFDRGGINDSN